MHIPDGFCSLPVSVGTGVFSAVVLGASVIQIVRKTGAVHAALPTTATAVVFSAQMLNFPIGAGTSGHFLGAMAVATLFGPYRACLIMLTVLAVQAFAFADGGITAIGANLLNMGVIAGFGGYGILRLTLRLLPKGRKSYFTAVGIASWCSVVLASLACSVELALSGTIPLSIVLPAMVGTHALIGIGEALITVALVGTISYAQPSLLPEWNGISNSTKAATTSVAWPASLIGAGFAFFLSAVISPFACSSPDGLEKVADSAGFMDRAKELWTMAPLPDYSVNAFSNPAVSTSLAGIIGVMLVLLTGYAVWQLTALRKQ